MCTFLCLFQGFVNIYSFLPIKKKKKNLKQFYDQMLNSPVCLTKIILHNCYNEKNKKRFFKLKRVFVFHCVCTLVWICMCVCVRERERDREKVRVRFHLNLSMASCSKHCNQDLLVCKACTQMVLALAYNPVWWHSLNSYIKLKHSSNGALKARLGSRCNHSLLIAPCLPRHALYWRTPCQL